MTSVEIPDTDYIYGIALLVNKGWRKSHFGNEWIHPEGKKYVKPERYDEWGVSAKFEEDFWPFHEAILEIEREEEMQKDPGWTQDF